MDPFEILAQCTGFQWDEGNFAKNWEKHQVSTHECEQIFFNQPLVVAEGKSPVVSENRYYALGSTDFSRLLFIVFTVRRSLIRVISARDMSRKERAIYEKQKKQITD